MKIVPLIAAALWLTCGSALARQAQEDVGGLIQEQANQLLATVHANVYAPDMPVNSALAQLTVANQEIRKDEKYTIFSGCRPQSCGEKAAAVLDNATRELAAVALLSYNCKDDILEPDEIAYLTTRQSGKRPALHCAHDPMLMVYKQFGYQGERIRIVNLY